MNDADELGLPTVGPDGLDELWDAVTRTLEIGDHVVEYTSHYDKSGNPISMRDWVRLREHGGRDYIVVQQDHVGPYFVSTVWLGLDHGMRLSNEGYRPIIFETMVFRDDESDLDCWRYSTEDEAREGHARMLEQVRAVHAATT